MTKLRIANLLAASSLLSVYVCVRVSVPEDINNQWRDMDHI